MLISKTKSVHINLKCPGNDSCNLQTRNR